MEGNCKLRQFNIGYGIAELSCDYVRKNISYMKSEFRKENLTDQIMKSGIIDKGYIKYCESLDNFLSQCQCVPKISLKCERCSEEDHERHFCRYEGRNIALDKQLRSEKDNRGEPERDAERSKRENIDEDRTYDKGSLDNILC